MPHDALDWFAAIGPTVAAGAAAIATWKTAKVAEQVGADSLRLQRLIQRPLIVIGSQRRLMRGGTGVHLIVELKNMGQTSGNIESFRVSVGGNEVKIRAMEPTGGFWTRVFTAATPGARINFKSGQVLLPHFAVSPGEIVPLVDVQLEGDVSEIDVTLNDINIDVRFNASWGEHYSNQARLGTK